MLTLNLDCDIKEEKPGGVTNITVYLCILISPHSNFLCSHEPLLTLELCPSQPTECLKEEQEDPETH